MFSGALMRMGKELGIPTPYNEYTYHMIKALEEKNDGLFDYSGKDQEPTWAKEPKSCTSAAFPAYISGKRRNAVWKKSSLQRAFCCCLPCAPR